MASTVAASDDSNTGIITPIPTNPSQGQYSPSLNATKTVEAIDKLSQGGNNTLPQTLVDQLKKDVQTGNNTDAAQTIRNLQSYVTSSNGTGISPTLKDLVQSLKVEPNGISVDPNILKSLLGDPNQEGVPAHLTGMDPARVANDLSTLSNLLRGIDPSTSLSLAQDSQQIQDLLKGLDGSSQGAVTIPPLPNMNVAGPNGGGFAPELPPVSPSVGTGFQLGGVNPIFIVPFIVAIVGAALVMMRRSPLSFNALRANSSSPKRSESLEKPEMSLSLGSARDLVAYYFRRTVAAMGKKGVTKLQFETHREFSAKCAPWPDAKPVGQVSSIYEKAMFSGREVTRTDVDEARENTLSVEGPPTSGPKDPVKPTRNS